MTPAANPFAGTVSSVNRAAKAGRADCYRRAGGENLAPFWRALHGLVTETPQSGCMPAYQGRAPGAQV